MPTAPHDPAGYADPREIDDLVAHLRRFERGELDAEQWRAYRVVRGAYSQRQDGVHMLRVKLPQGVADAAALRALADVASRHSRAFGHVTTRQNFQLHFLSPAALEPALRRLAEAGVTTAGAGGNAVRNVTVCPDAGVAPGEVFDPTPYAEALTRHFLRHPLSASLPRKFKIAFEGCAGGDHVGLAIQDLSFRATVRLEGGSPRRGFAVAVAGGTSTAPTAAAPLVDFLPAAEVLALAEAVLRVFHARGDRKNKARNRLKFLVKDLGQGPFRALVRAELEAVRAAGAPALPFDPESPPEARPPRGPRPPAPSPEAAAARVRAAPPRGPGQPPEVAGVLAPDPAALALFRRTNVRPQRQPGHVVVTVSAPQGDVTAAQLEVLADLALAHGDGAVRLASEGRLHLRWIAEADVPAVHACLAAAGLARPGAGSAADVVACPGAEACRLAVTRTRGVARLVEERLRAAGDAVLSAPLAVHVSGCPNGCSRHHVAAIGLQGSARRVGDRTVPQYVVLLGGTAAGPGARFGALAGKVPARRLPAAVERLAAWYLSERHAGEAAAEFFARRLADARALLAPLEELRPEDLRPEDLVEPGAEGPFAPATQAGECAA